MPARSTIRTQVLDLLGDHSMVTASDVNDLLSAEHETILEDTSWARRKQETVVETVATYATGTVTTSGATVTGSGTTFTSGMVDRWIRIGSNPFFHRISAFTSTTVITVEEALPADVTAATSYTIFRHIYDLPSDFGRVLSFTLDTKLREVPKSDVDRIDPYRTSTASRPDTYNVRGPDAGLVWQVEFWPVPSAATGIRLEYLRTNTLTADTDEPLYRSDILKWKTAAAGAYRLYARTGDRAWLDLATRYHQHYLETLQGAREDNMGKFSAQSRVRDAWRDGSRSSDWYTNHDPGWR